LATAQLTHAVTLGMAKSAFSGNHGMGQLSPTVYRCRLAHDYLYVKDHGQCVGFDLIEKQSGDSAKTYGISHRGDPFHRQTLVWMANLVVGHHPTFGQVFMVAEARGLGVWGAAIHTAHKLNRVCFRLLAQDRPYAEDTPPEDFTRWRSYWIAYRQYRRDPKQFDDPGPWTPSR
jgi:hypothetical protein